MKTYEPNYSVEIDSVVKTEPKNTLHTFEVDWNYTFEDPKHTQSYCMTDHSCQRMVARKKQLLKQCEDNFGTVTVSVCDSGGYYHEVINMGMGSFWPYWSPRPVLLVQGTLGTEWFDWMQLSNVKVEKEQ